MNRKEIEAILPHGESFIFLSNIIKFNADSKSIHGNFRFTSIDSRMQGHFEKEKLFPAAFQLESLAQLSGVLLYLTNQNLILEQKTDNIGYLTKSNVVFKSMIQPDSIINLYSKIKSVFGLTTEFLVSAYINDVCACEGSIRLTTMR